MKNGTIYLSVLCGLLASVSSFAQGAEVDRDGEICGIGISGASMKRQSGLMTLGMNFALADFHLKDGVAAVFTPYIINGADSLALHPVGVYGRSRWWSYQRSGETPSGAEDEESVRMKNRPDVLEWRQIVPYEEWMNGASLVLFRRDYGCCRTPLGDSGQSGPLAGYMERPFVPAYRYVTPPAETSGKVRELSGRAFIDFPVNITTIYADYRSNASELSKITSTIDSVRNDSDITVRSLFIKGYASPEGDYDNNARLAKERTEALKSYVRNLYRFPDGFISTDFEPEDWAGLREWVAASAMDAMDEILAIIDGPLEPDPKNWKIKSSYPQEYDFLLHNVYPALRHSDYTIEYSIRTFTDVDEIAELLRSRPQKLSLNEMFLLSQIYAPGSDEFNDVFETAARMYPSDETANLNAANSAMERNDLISAGKYLDRAGDSAEAVYARGMLAGLQGDYDEAERLVNMAAGKGLSGTEDMLAHISEVKLFVSAE